MVLVGSQHCDAGTPDPSPGDTLASPILVRGIRPKRVVIEASARGVTGSKVVVVTRIITRPSVSR